MNKLLEETIKEAIDKKVRNQKDFWDIIRKVHKKHKNQTFPSNIILLKAYRAMVEKGQIKKHPFLERLLVTKKIRSLSGVSIITCLTQPYPCPGKCTYCPFEEGVPKSYLSNEPAVMRAILNSYDPKKQVLNRLQALYLEGHPTSKVELIVIGGTFSVLPLNYQINFIKNCLDALNGISSCNLEEAKRLNEIAPSRLVGLTLETRPDFIIEREIKRMRKLGATRVELGVQSIYDDVLRKCNRGHKVESTIKATQLLKDVGFKICYHMMPNLPGSNLGKDELMFRKLFSKSDFQPDYLKIYPCVVLKGTLLYDWWKEGKYKPYSDQALLDLIKKIKLNIPYYVRIKRVIRDIPAVSIIAGSKISNLRQILEQKMEKEDWKCRCIRCREIKDKKTTKDKKTIKLFRMDYDASGGREIFLSYEDKKREHLYSLLRLRIPSQYFSKKKHFISALDKSSIIREVHTYGSEVEVGKKEKTSVQHKGLGKDLIKKAEEITKKEFGLSKIAVISGIGIRDYYLNLGYELKQEYMVKKI